MTKNYKLYFTRQALAQLKLIKAKRPKNYALLIHQQLSELCYYPLQGRLLLNRKTVNNETERLCWQLAKRFPNTEFREIAWNNYVILYLAKQTKLYILGVISLQSAFSGIELYWQTEHNNL